MPDQVENLVRPDGSIIQATGENAATLKAFGYKEEDPNLAGLRADQEAKEAYYTTPTQKLKTLGEGALGGLTLGLSDQALVASGASTSERSQYNPGYRLAGDIIGVVAPAVLSGGESLVAEGAALTPAGLLTRGAAAAGSGVKSALGRGLVTGAIEGAGFGVGAQVSNAALKGDPLTTEGIMAGVGWGAVWGGGIGAIAGGISGAVEARAAAKKVAVDKLAADEAVATLAKEETYGALHTAVHDAAGQANKAFKVVEEEVSKAEAAVGDMRKGSEAYNEALKQQTSTVMNQAANIRHGYFNESIPMEVGNPAFRNAKKEAISHFNAMKDALSRKDYEGMAQASERFSERLKAMGGGQTFEPLNLSNLSKTIPDPEVEARLARSSQAMDEAKSLGMAGDTLKTFPTTAEGFSRMTPGRFEKINAAVETFTAHPAAEFSSAQEAIKAGIADMAEKVGIAAEGTPTVQLRGIWETMKGTGTAGAKEVAERAAGGALPWAGKAASKLAQGKYMALGLLSLKQAIVGGVSKAALSWVPSAFKALSKIGPKLDPLKVRLDGTVDVKAKNRRELMQRRAEEMRSAAGSVRDTLYRGVAPLDPAHPELASAMHAHAVDQFSFMLNKLPKDPGNAFNKLQSLWGPDALETEKFARYYGVLHDPIGVMQRALTQNNISPEEAEGMREMWPALYTHLRSTLLARLSDPQVMAKVSYPDQVRLGTLLQLPLHSTLTPQFVASQQQMFQQRSQPLNMNQQPGAGGGGGRPSGPSGSPYASQGDKVTAH